MTEKSDCCDANIVWELWTCDKNLKGEIPEPIPHGNSIEGTTTCEDDYCSPTTEVLDYIPSDEFIRTHECHSRCSSCNGLTGD